MLKVYIVQTDDRINTYIKKIVFVYYELWLSEINIIVFI